MDREKDFLLALLNSRPLIEGIEQDALADEAEGRQWLRDKGGIGTLGELRAALVARDLLSAVVRGESDPTVLSAVVGEARRRPELTAGGLTWRLEAPADTRLAVGAVLGWAALNEDSPGRLRPCANDTCRLFLLDRSRANSARWCSMATCGNRLKARRHHERKRMERA
jgi:predicted RNA-binding Zn ribbon-like protein